MSRRAAIAFSNELHLLIERFTNEWNLTWNEAVGSLELAKAELIDDFLSECAETEEEEEGDDA